MTFTAPNQTGLAVPMVAAIDNGGTNTRIRLLEGLDVDNGHLYAEVFYPTPADYTEAIELIGRTTTMFATGKSLNAIGLAVAGKVIDGVIMSAGELEKNGWCKLPFATDIGQATGLGVSNIVMMNDCVAAAKAQQAFNRRTRSSKKGYVETISTGWGGAGFDVSSKELFPDEPGHEFLKAGAMCGCKQDGHAEAHISGSGIERKFGVRGESLNFDLWPIIIADMVEAHKNLLQRLARSGFKQEALHLFGSVALKQWRVLPGLQRGLEEVREELPDATVPAVVKAIYGDSRVW